MVNLEFFLETQPQAWAEVLDLSLTEVDQQKIQMVKNSYGQTFELQPIVRFYYDFAFFGSPATYNCCYKRKPCQPTDYPSHTYIWVPTLQKWEKRFTSTHHFRIMLDFIHSGIFLERIKNNSGGHTKRTCARP